jgi:hypothetical protein
MQQETIDKYSHLLDPGPDAEEADYWNACVIFINACAFEEKGTYKLVAKDGPDTCSHPSGQGVNCDKVCNLHSGDVYDMVINGGTAMQSPAFNRTGGNVDKNQMVDPVDPGLATAPPVTTPGFPPYPGDHHFDPIGQALFDDYAEAKTAPNPGMSRWFGRCDYDYLTGICETNVDAVNKHRPDWRKELGLPPKASSVG